MTDSSYINITIPAFKEPDIISTLKSVLDCDVQGIEWRIDILINHSESADTSIKAFNNRCFDETKQFIEAHGLEDLIHLDMKAFPDKQAGVGLARKTLMDDAAHRFQSQEINGIIVALDADCIVSRNYLKEIVHFFENHPFEAASIHYEHPIDDWAQSKAIIEYEWHLRYFIEMQGICGFPFAYHTVGSSMACRSASYLAKGGMNKRKAGEDFYFLQKFIKDQVCGRLNSATVYPSGRISDRVPFGTGRAVGKYQENNYSATSYNPKSFEILKRWNEKIEQQYDAEELAEVEDEVLKQFLETIQYREKLIEIRRHISSKKAFLKRFYQYFDAFQLMKCLHYLRESYPDLAVDDVRLTAEKMRWFPPSENMVESLYLLRKIQQETAP